MPVDVCSLGCVSMNERGELSVALPLADVYSVIIAEGSSVDQKKYICFPFAKNAGKAL